MNYFMRDNRFGPGAAATIGSVQITLAQFRALMSKYSNNVDDDLNNLTPATQWFRTPDYDLWQDPASAFNPTTSNVAAGANCKTSHRSGAHISGG